MDLTILRTGPLLRSISYYHKRNSEEEKNGYVSLKEISSDQLENRVS
jgi:hypothetical protein